MTTIIRLLALLGLLHGDAPPPARPVLTMNVIAARAAASPEVPAELLLALARTESSFDPTWVSRVEAGERVTGRWRSTRAAGTGPRFCGYLQTIAGGSWALCLAQRDPFVAYTTARRELAGWLRAAEGDWRRALCGYGGGFASMRARSCGSFPHRVLRRAARLGWAPSRPAG